MRYNNLNHLVRESSSSRRYFFSLPFSVQRELDKYNEYIHTAAELHRCVNDIEIYNRQVQISKQKFLH